MVERRGANTYRSLQKGLVWKSVIDLAEQVLVVWSAPSEGEKLDGVLVEIDDGSDEALSPVAVDDEGISVDLH